MATAAAVLARADSYAGFVEGPRNNETPFGAWAGAQFQAWCASFVSFCLAHEGESIGRITYCPAGVAYFRDRGRLFTRPQVGDVFYLWFPSKNRYAHTGFVKRVEGDFIITREGNSNAAGSRTGGAVVSLKRGFAGTRTVFGRPDYDAPAPPPKPTPTPTPPATIQENRLVICTPSFATVQANGRIEFLELRPVDKDTFTVVLHNSVAGGVKLVRTDGKSSSGLPYMTVDSTTGDALGPPFQLGDSVYVACKNGGVYKVATRG